ncbi:hypothetical protein PanWU01x14_050190 [Parasponia andersonii]|uniref:Uncharacterized protein n=1 Tax=Parasponia andersonii TaxID=3476 RepID=A0A2P5DMT9_PARAD|nr:hypothetical protein PanWU01x14_050190 [Parasponia andersonii]
MATIKPTYQGGDAGIDCTAQDIYKNELSEHFKLNGGDENNLDLLCARRFIPPDMTQECKMVEICMTQLQSQVISFASSSLTQSIPSRINEILIADKILGTRRGYRRGVGPMLKGVVSTSSTATSPLWDPLVLDSELRDFFN